MAREDLRLAIKRRVVAIFEGQHLHAGVAGPAAIGRSGAAAWTIVAQARQAYFGRAIRKQSLAFAVSAQAHDDQAFVDAASVWGDE